MPDDQTNPTPPRPVGPPESLALILGRPLGLLGLLLALAAWHARPLPRAPEPVAARVAATIPAPAPTPAVPVAAAPEPNEPNDDPPPAPAAPPAPALDQAAVARAEAALDAASAERAHADARLADAEQALEKATRRAARDLAEGKAIAGKVRDPSARIAAASSKGGFLKGERDRLKNELAALERVPVPKARALMAKTAVAKPTDGTEYHFEVRGNRVSFVDLERLVEMVKSDARMRLRSSGPKGRIGGTVGPVGPFSLRYAMGRSVSDALAEMLDARDATYNLLGWELIPTSPTRGESIEMTRSPTSNYGRALHRLVPGRDTITMWIYPDGFAMYRQLRDDLHAHGFLVAARPLPDGTSIKGSPSGSVSAGQ